MQEAEICTYGEKPHNLRFGYSNSMYVLLNLIRIEPYTSIFIQENSKFDSANRMMSSVEDEWIKVWNSSQCNVELTPEWFYLPQIFKNNEGVDFGIRDDKTFVWDVDIPKYGKQNHYLYWMNLRKSLENHKFCKNINIWIDMVFGSKQQSKECMNVFFEYSTADYYAKIKDKNTIDRNSLKSAADLFQLPWQLFIKDHTKRYLTMYCEDIVGYENKSETK